MRNARDSAPSVSVAGNVLGLLALVAVVLVFARSRWAPLAAIVIGFANAAGFAVSHLLPYWSVFSDPFTHPEAGSGVNAVSRITALLGIAAALLFGYAGLRVRQTAEA